jgi:hypothetical protein
VEESVLRLLVDVAEVELVVTDQRVFKEALVHQFDLHFSILELMRLQVLRFKEDVLVPDRNTSIVDFLLGRRVFPLAQTVNLHEWVSSLFRVNHYILGLLHVNVNHVVAAFHLRDLILVLLRRLHGLGLIVGVLV